VAFFPYNTTHPFLIFLSLTLRHKEDFSMAINFLNSDTKKESLFKGIERRNVGEGKV
jgi:hypothetical protein